MASSLVDCTSDFDFSNVRGKTAIVTGGAQGIGEAYVRALANAGAYVAIGDIDTKRAEKLISEFPGQLHFTRCDVTQWGDQVALFDSARTFSPDSLIHYVVANAGISPVDEIYGSTSVSDDTSDISDDKPPPEPSLAMIDVNFKGLLYTTNLALHHFRRQYAAATRVAEQQQKSTSNGNGHPPADIPKTCLVLQGSIAAYLDASTFCQYASSKWAVRGMLHTLRRVVGKHGTRVNAVCPSFLRTALVPSRLIDLLDAKGIALAAGEDAGACLLRVVSDTNMNGRALCVVARGMDERAPQGYYDLDLDEKATLGEPWTTIFE